MARGGTDSPVNRELTILASVWLEFGTGMESTTRQTFLRARIGSAARGAEISYGAAALPNYGEEFSHARRERERRKGHDVFVTLVRC